jgi:large subunit ribosomal protein L35
MPKAKPRKSIRAKFKVTGTGKLLRNQSGRRHLLVTKSPKRKRQMRRQELVSEAHLKTYKYLMGV